MPSICAVSCCSNDSRRTKGIRYFYFPRNKKRQEEWMRACGRLNIKNPKNSFVCSRHFADDDYKMKYSLLDLPDTKYHRLLKNTAVPSLLLSPNQMPHLGESTKIKEEDMEIKEEELEIDHETVIFDGTEGVFNQGEKRPLSPSSSEVLQRPNKQLPGAEKNEAEDRHTMIDHSNKMTHLGELVFIKEEDVQIKEEPELNLEEAACFDVTKGEVNQGVEEKKVEDGQSNTYRSDMNADFFYGGRPDTSSEDSDDSDFSVSSDDPGDDLSDESEESETGEDQDEQDETPDGNDSSGRNGNNTRPEWLPVSSKQRMHAFTGKEEMSVTVNNADDETEVLPIDLYALFVSDTIIDMIVLETNRYAQQEIDAARVTRRSRLVSWKPTDREEMKRFFGIVIYMGLVVKPEIQLYWSKSTLYDDPFVPKLMSRERFEILYRCLHFVDNTAYLNSQDKLYKVRPLIDLLVNNFQSVYKPGSKLVVDESMVPFRGRLGIKQYTPGKAHKYGMKVYKACTPEGYTWNLEVHVGKGDNTAGLNSTESRVVNLCNEMLGKGCTIYSDNYYTSVILAEYLLVKKTYICGTVRPGRKYLCKEVVKAKLKKGEMKAAENRQGVKLYKWKDKRDVLTLSTVPEHGNGLLPSGKKNRKGEEIVKPESVIEYNKAKKGVDVADQLSSYYSPLRKSRKWYRKLALEMIAGISVINAQILFNKYCSAKQVGVRAFTESVILSLTKNIHEEITRSGKRTSDISGARKEHTLQEADGQKKNTRKRCRGCYEKISQSEGYKVATNKARRVSTFCNECDGQPHLCIPCFNEKHDAYNM